MTDLDLAAWREVLEAATPGPWTQHRDSVEAHEARASGSALAACPHSREDAAYIALCSPDRVRALLDEVEHLRALNGPGRVLDGCKWGSKWIAGMGWADCELCGRSH